MATLTLYINGTEQNQVNQHLSVISLVKNRRDPAELVFHQNVKFDQASYHPQQGVVLSVDGTVHFRGYIKDVNLMGNPENEGVEYLALGLEDKLDEIMVTEDGSYRVVYNAEKNEVDYNSSRYGMTVGQIVSDLFSICDFTGTGINGASGESSMTQIPPRVSFEGKTLKQALEILLSYQCEFDYHVAPASQIVVFYDVTDLVAKNITFPAIGGSTVGKDHVIDVNLTPTTKNCYTRCIIEGETLVEKVVDVTNKDYNETLEATYTPAEGSDPESDYYRVFRAFELPDDNVLPYNIFSNQGPTFLIDNYFGYRSEYVGGDMNYGEGKILLDIPSYDHNVGVYSYGGMTAHYTCKGTPIKADTGWTGTAYSTYGLKRPFVIWDSSLQKQYFEMKVWGTATAGGNTRVYVRECLKTGINWGDDSYMQHGGSQYTIISNEKHYVLIHGSHSLSIGDSITLYLRNDSSKLTAWASNFIKQYKNIRYTGTVSINDIDMAFSLQHKINLQGTNNSTFASMNAPVRSIEFNFVEDRMTITLTDDNTIPAEELRRRIFTKEKSKDFESLQAGRHELIQGGQTKQSKTDKEGTGGGGMVIHAHSAMTDEEGGNQIAPSQLWMVSGSHLIIDGGGSVAVNGVEYINSNNLNARYR